MYEPLHRHRPSFKWTNGDIAAKVGADLGIPPDDEQRWLLDSIYAEKAPDRPAAFEVVGIGPRQNFKTSTFGVAALADLFVFGVEAHVWSAHLLDTASKTFADFKRWIRSNPEYDEQVSFKEGHQDLSITLRGTGAYIDFDARSGKAGRGFTGIKRVTLDEALFLESKHTGAMYPTMVTQPSAQVRIASSAGLVTSDKLRQIRDRGRSGKDPRLAYVEYGARKRHCADPGCLHVIGTEGCALDDREAWWEANCALWAGRITEESLEDQRRSLDAEEWMREFFTWWEDPVSVGGALPFGRWLELADPDVERGDDVIFGLDVAHGSAWIAVAWRRGEDIYVTLTKREGSETARAFPAHRVVEECQRLTDKWGGIVIPPTAFEDDLERAGVPILKMAASKFPAACESVSDLVTAGKIRHGNEPALNEAVKSAQWRTAGTQGQRAFQLKDAPEIGPLAAAARALWGIENVEVDAWGFFD